MALQWSGASLAFALVLAATGSASVTPVVLAVLGAAAAWPRLRRGPLSRAGLQALARRAALLHGATASLAVTALWIAAPDWLAGAHPPATALAACLLCAASGFVLSLCGLNATAEPWGDFNGASPPPRTH